MSKMVIYNRLNPPKEVYSKSLPTKIVTFRRVQDVKVLDKDNDVFEIVEKSVIENEVDTAKLTKSYQGKTGLEAVIKRVAITGDFTLLEDNSPYPSFMDATKIPTTLGEVKQTAAKLQGFDSLPAELVKGRSAEEFLASVTMAEIEAYAKAKIGGSNNATVIPESTEGGQK